MKRKIRRKGLTLNWLNYTFAFVVGTLFFFIVYSILTSGTVKVEREIAAQTLDMKSEQVLVGFLSGYVIKDNDVGLSGDAKRIAAELADSKTTIAGLISMINDKDEAMHKQILGKEIKYVLDRTIGENMWKLDVTFPEGSSMSYGGVQGDTKVYETILPATGYKTTKVTLTVISKQDETQWD